ncbi:DNA repair protein RadA [Amycolatopsis keratiniphila]|uniref:DNA repair protein RadA n=2 Tax=Amycolatopsis keratiniphila TaxID=129921 RepID=R4T5B0_9PSEU|nr:MULTISPECIES: DNA repair protein RadA [Amycolatopsis]AGM10015.1 DNA repair protein RadA/Sms [Amycolatopsis keratiniphila]OLZ52190.1 DNA repair protein RadA [Amycolatopsis keratiniphila subsp. nogabecina]ONF64396.1 DNA repair protein RadA [Amycolatopsis keratiniphila subsp. keratiniphila]RSN21806.1 DNA repair protein RadA [Amycolatopsis sp. WAC 04169]SDU60273.1 DNA repair protein RadA/Sms [Amycolatopsis keratiniphila]
MVKKGSTYRCGECGYEAPKWVGRCPECQAWGTLEERGDARPAIARVAAGAPSAPARPIGEVDVETARAKPTGVSELDRVLGGGFVPGAVILLAGEPGVGKSTLLLEVAYQWAATAGRALYVTGEESAGQVRLRAERTGNVHDEMFLAAESDLSAILGHVDAVKPGVLIVDSVQTMASPQVEGAPGGVTQVRAVTSGLVALAKERGLPIVLVGHVTKDGSVAGPRVLEHLVDVVLQFEGDKHSTLRMLRGIKNRFGAADEIGCFELVEEGIVGVPDPSGLFLSHTAEPVAGTAVTVTMEGKRPLLGEVQALVSATQSPQPRRAVSGLDSARVAMVLAVVEKRAGIKVGDKDVYVATVGGMKITEPGIDLAVVLALMSSARDTPLSPKLVAMGEVGLSGEVRRVPSVGRRLAEAARLGFTYALVPPDSGKIPPGIRVLEVGDVASALNAAKHAR